MIKRYWAGRKYSYILVNHRSLIFGVFITPSPTMIVKMGLGFFHEG